MFHVPFNGKGSRGSSPFVEPGEGIVHGHLLEFNDFNFANVILGTMMSETNLVKELCEVSLEDGSKEQAFTYFGKDLTEEDHGLFIEHGNWQKD